MKLKQLVIYVVVLAAAAGLYFWSLEAEQGQKKQEDAAARVAALKDPLNVQTVELAGSEYLKPVRIERRDKEHQWWMTAPVNGLADSMAVGRLIGEVLDARVKKRIKKDVKAADFGLDPPRIKITLTDRKGAAQTLLVGDISPTKEFVYARLAKGKEVLLLPAKLRGAWALPLSGLRDKAALDFVVADVERLELRLEKDKPALVVERKKAGANPRWEFADQAEAASNEIEDLLFQLHGLRVVEFLDQGIDLAKMGLEPPGGMVAMGLKGGGKAGLIIGGNTQAGGEKYTRRLSGGPVMVIKEGSLQRLARERKALAERRVFRVDRRSVVGLSITGGGEKLVYAKKEGAWQRTEPPGDLKSGAPGALLVYDLAELKWEKKLPQGPDYGLKPPQVGITLQIKPEEGEKNRSAVVAKKLLLGKMDKENGLLPAQIQGDDTIYGLNPDFLKSVPRHNQEKKANKPG